MICLHGHPTLTQQKQRIHLLRSVREIKTTFGVDTVGCVWGEDIAVRALEGLAMHLGHDKAVRYEHDVDAFDARSGPWWTPIHRKDKKHDLDVRYAEFFATFSLMEFESCIVVGHSLFFREMCARFMSDELHRSKPALYSNLKTLKLKNASCVRLDIDVSNPAAPRIVDADLFLDAEFVKKEGSKGGKGGSSSSSSSSSWWSCSTGTAASHSTS